MQEKDFSKVEVKNNICINVFGYEDELVFTIYVSDQKFEDSMGLLLLIDDNKSHYVYIKDLDRFMFHKTKNKNKKWFCKSCLQCFSSENVLIKHKEDCLSINGKQSVKLEKGTIEFENYFKQIPVPFKVYADFECNLEGVESYEGSYTNKYQDHVLCSFSYKVACIDDRFSKPVVVFRGENAAYEFIKAIYKEYKYCKNVMNKHLNKNLIMREVWLIGVVTNFQLTKKVPVIFHNLRGYNSHLIFCELNKFDVKIRVIPNGLEKYMAFFLNKNLVLIDSMQFMNSSLDKHVKNLSD